MLNNKLESIPSVGCWGDEVTWWPSASYLYLNTLYKIKSHEDIVKEAAARAVLSPPRTAARGELNTPGKIFFLVLKILFWRSG